MAGGKNKPHQLSKHQRKVKAKLEGRINAWMASQKMQKDQQAYKKPGSRKL